MTPYATMATNGKPPVKHFRVFGCPAIFKRYVINDKGKTTTKINILNKEFEESLLEYLMTQLDGYFMYQMLDEHMYL